MERTLLFNFPVSLRDVLNWQHLGDVAISAANIHFAPLPDLATFFRHAANSTLLHGWWITKPEHWA
jgi:hypothetical protein